MTEDPRPFGLWTASALVVGGMIGAGIYVQPTQLAPFGWTGAVAWLLAIPGALVLAYVLTRLTQARPQATGILEIIGDALGPLSGVLVGWSYWIGIVSANAIIALTAVRYGASFVPTLIATPIATAGAAIVLIWLLTALNLSGVKAAGRFQVLTTVLKLLPLLAVVLILAGIVAAQPGTLTKFEQPRFASDQLVAGITLAFFPMVGFEAASLAAERVADPARNVIRATLWGTALTGLFYVVICNGIIFAMPPGAIAQAKAPVALFVSAFWGSKASLLVAAFASLSAIGCLNGWVLMQGELPLGMARAGLLPRSLGHTNRHDVPIVAILAATAIATLLVLSSALPGLEGALTFMLRLTTASTVWFYALACAAAVRLGLVVRLAWLGMGISAVVLWGSGLEALILSIVLMLSAVPLYLIAARRPLSSAGSS